MRSYIALIHVEKKSDYGVSFPDFPGCASAGRTLEEARAMATEALAFHVEGMLEDGEEIPEPSTLDSVVADRRNGRAVAFLVELPEEMERVARVNITLPKPLLQRVDAAAGRVGETRSSYLATAARERLAATAHPGTSLGKSTGTKRRA